MKILKFPPLIQENITASKYQEKANFFKSNYSQHVFV
jgi:hypothetical protein